MALTRLSHLLCSACFAIGCLTAYGNDSIPSASAWYTSETFESLSMEKIFSCAKATSETSFTTYLADIDDIYGDNLFWKDEPSTPYFFHAKPPGVLKVTSPNNWDSISFQGDHDQRDLLNAAIFYKFPDGFELKTSFSGVADSMELHFREGTPQERFGNFFSMTIRQLLFAEDALTPLEDRQEQTPSRPFCDVEVIELNRGKELLLERIAGSLTSDRLLEKLNTTFRAPADMSSVNSNQYMAIKEAHLKTSFQELSRSCNDVIPGDLFNAIRGEVEQNFLSYRLN